MKRIAILLILTTFSLTIFAQQDRVKKGEKVEVSLSDKVLPTTQQAQAGVPAAVWALGINLGLPAVKALLVKRGKKFTATYGSSVENQTFYEDKSSFDLKYKGLAIVRKVDLDDTKKGVEALQVQFRIEQSDDKSSFRFVPHKLSFKHAKAKVKKTVDLTISVEINTTWTDDKGVGQSKKIGESKFVFKKLKLASEYDDQKLEEKGLAGDWLAIPPRSLHPKKGQGNVSFKVSIIETDDFGKRYESISKFLDDNNDSINSFLTAILGLDDD